MSANTFWRIREMRKHIGLVVLLALFSVVAFAQESAPKAEIFGGYQYTRFDGGTNANGWNTSVTGNLNNWFGIVGDFSGHYVDGVSLHLFQVGPKFTYRGGGRVD